MRLCRDTENMIALPFGIAVAALLTLASLLPVGSALAGELAVEASDAVEKVVPLADPGTRESLRIPLQDELDHIAFGVNRLKQELSHMELAERESLLARIPGRIQALNQSFHGRGLNVKNLFEAVGANYDELCKSVLYRKDEILKEVAEPIAA